LVIDCYRLADWYKQHPDAFLNIPLSEVGLHIHRTVQLIRIKARERQDADDG
jgi:hypothetical protein